jgi:hypothetical protein
VGLGGKRHGGSIGVWPQPRRLHHLGAAWPLASRLLRHTGCLCFGTRRSVLGGLLLLCLRSWILLLLLLLLLLRRRRRLLLLLLLLLLLPLPLLLVLLLFLLLLLLL